MRGLRTIALLLATALFVASGAGAKRSPRLEKLAPVAADTAKATNATVRSSDLPSGWMGGPIKPGESTPPDCPWQNFSRYTITGQSEADYSQADVKIVSAVQVFPSPKQALGDFAIDTRAGTAACEGAVIRQSFGKAAKLVSAKLVAAPKVGNRAVEFQFAVKLGVDTFYVNVIEFVRDRSLGGLITLSAAAPLNGREALAGLMDARLQSGIVAY